MMKLEASLIYKISGILLIILGIAGTIFIFYFSSTLLNDPYPLFFPLFVLIGIGLYLFGREIKKYKRLNRRRRIW